jgi:acyl-CoA dehydrogenase
MNFDYTPKVQELREKLLAFFDEHIYPNERAFAERDRRQPRQRQRAGCRPN